MFLCARSLTCDSAHRLIKWGLTDRESPDHERSNTGLGIEYSERSPCARCAIGAAAWRSRACFRLCATCCTSRANDPQLWFLLGYAARLNGKYQESVDAYTHGLRLNPSSPDGLSGLAQVYSLMGRTDDAERLLKQVISSRPERETMHCCSGIFTCDRRTTRAPSIGWTRRNVRSLDARSELLLALCYQQLKQMDLASHYLDLGRAPRPR